MITRLLLRNARHITLSVLCVLGSFILARGTGQFFVRLKLLSNGNCPLDLNLNPMFCAYPSLQKNIQSDMICI